MKLDERTDYNLRFLYPGLREYLLRSAEAHLAENPSAGAAVAVRAALKDRGDALAREVAMFFENGIGARAPVGELVLIQWTVTRWEA